MIAGKTTLTAVPAAAGEQEGVLRSGPEMVVLLTMAGGVMFTLIAVAAWVGGRRAGGGVMAAFAGVCFAYGVALLLR